MKCSWKTGWLNIFAIALCALAAAGCASMKSSGIDPSGERVFTAPPPPITVNPSNPSAEGFYDQPLTQNAYDDVVVTLKPQETVAPVGSEVVLVAGVGGSDGYLRTNRRLEWTIAQGSVGHFVSVGENGLVDILLGDFNRPRKIDNSFAVGGTLRANVRLNRGACSRQDDVYVRRGEGWISLTSPSEGTSNVTVFAPEVYAWSERIKSATVHWVDALWQFPAAAINPAGTKHVFTTTVTRQSNHAPCEGWLVRYEIVEGPPAGFTPTGATAIEARVDSTGQAHAEIFQPKAVHGVNKICIQVIRPADSPGAGGKKLVVGRGMTSKTWTSPDLAVNVAGPPTAAAGATINYRIDVSNPGDMSVKDVVATVAVPNGLTYLASNPSAGVSGNQLQWRLGELGARQRQSIAVSFRAETTGSFSTRCDVAAAGGLKVSNCATTTVSVPTVGAPTVGTPLIKIKISGPDQATVGGEVDYVIDVTNAGQTPATDLIIKVDFDSGLEHKRAKGENSLKQKLGTLAAGESIRLPINFVVTNAGRLSYRVQVTGPGIAPATAQAFVTSVAAGGTPPEPATPQLPFSVKLKCPNQRTVGEMASILIEVRNLGTTPLHDLTLVSRSDQALIPKFATKGREVDMETGSLRWKIDTLEAGKATEIEIQCACEKAVPNAITSVVVSEPGGGIAKSDANMEILAAGPTPSPTNPEPTAPTTSTDLKIVVAGLTNPVTEGKELTYEIRVTNQGPVSYRQINVKAMAPEGMTPVPIGTMGPESLKFKIDRQAVLFDPISEIRPNETLTYRVRVYAQAPARQRHFSVELSSPALPQPIMEGVDTEVVKKPSPTGGI